MAQAQAQAQAAQNIMNRYLTPGSQPMLPQLQVPQQPVMQQQQQPQLVPAQTNAGVRYVCFYFSALVFHVHAHTYSNSLSIHRCPDLAAACQELIALQFFPSTECFPSNSPSCNLCSPRRRSCLFRLTLEFATWPAPAAAVLVIHFRISVCQSLNN